MYDDRLGIFSPSGLPRMVVPLVTTDVWKHMDELEQGLLYYIVNAGQATMRQLLESTGRSRPVIRRSMNRLIDMHIVTEVATSRLAPNKYFKLRLP